MYVYEQQRNGGTARGQHNMASSMPKNAHAPRRNRRLMGSVSLVLCACLLVAVLVTSFNIGNKVDAHQQKKIQTLLALRNKEEKRYHECSDFVKRYTNFTALLYEGGAGRGEKLTLEAAVAALERDKELNNELIVVNKKLMDEASYDLRACNEDQLQVAQQELYGATTDNATEHEKKILAEQVELEEKLAEALKALSTAGLKNIAINELRETEYALRMQKRHQLFSMLGNRTNAQGMHECTYIHQLKHICATSPNVYSVVFDLGSTGNRVHVFNFSRKVAGQNEDDDENYPTGGQRGCWASRAFVKDRAAWMASLHVEDALFLSNSNPLSKFAQEDPQGAVNALQALFEAALNYVPQSLRQCTPLEFKATSGLRALGPNASSRILAAIEDHFAPMTMTEEDRLWAKGAHPVRILEGSEEGPLAWITVNFLLDKFLTSSQESGNAAPVSTAAIIDLGGGSTQIVFEPTSAEVLKGRGDGVAFNATLGDREVRAYQHSYEGLGLVAASKELLRRVQGKDTGPLPEALRVLGTFVMPRGDNEAAAHFPCFAINYADSSGVSNTINTNNNRDPEKEDGTYAPNFIGCAALFDKYVVLGGSSKSVKRGVEGWRKRSEDEESNVHRAEKNDGNQHKENAKGSMDDLAGSVQVPCYEGTCGCQGVYQPLLADFDGPLYAYSFIYDILLEYLTQKSSEVVTLEEIEDFGIQKCGNLTLSSINQANAAIKASNTAPPSALKPEYACMHISYVYALLKYGYGVPPGREIHIAKKIRGFETAWPLGSALTTLAM